MFARFLSVLVLSVIVGAAGAHAQDDRQRLNRHQVTNPKSPVQQPGAEKHIIPSLVQGLKGKEDWHNNRRPEILKRWTTILGKLGPNEADGKWFGDIRKAVIREKSEEASYTRILLDLPMETDFLQPHVLLLPKKPANGKRPAVICWTSSTPDYTMPEQWWGKWLAERGYVVLTGWSFIRSYRGATKSAAFAAELHRDRFGHWLPIARMVYDVQREAEYLRSLPDVDPDRIGFIGFSLSAKTAVYVSAFAPEIAATVAVDPHIAANGGTNWYAPWYMDWLRPYPDIPTPEHTVLSMLDTDAETPGFEHDHHEVMALAAPRPFLLIGGRGDLEATGGDSDDRQSWGYFNRAKEVYTLLGVPDRIGFVLTTDGHRATGPTIDPAWQGFFERWLRGNIP